MITKVPTLIIGLGGIGSEIVDRIENKTQVKGSKVKEYNRNNIQFVIMDTDENSIRERRKSGYKGFSVSLAGDVSVGKCLEWDEDAREHWFPKDNIFNLKTISEGAGQIRAVSRLAFQRAIRIGALSPLYDAIELLFRQSESYTNQALKIVIVSTIAGGTGSGMFLPLAMHVREFVKKKYSGSEVKIDACLILPDVLETLRSTNRERDNLFSNGYAALKELSYFMYRTDNGLENEKVHIKLPDDENHGLVTYKDSPFDFCFLFGKLTMRKRTLGTLEAYKDAVERCIYTQFIGTYSSQFFSVEDNMLYASINGTLPKANGREIILARFASANCFRVYYPYKEIREYLSLYWGLDIMANEWLKYDEEVKKFEYEQRKKREYGLNGIEWTDSESFVAAVERLKEKDTSTAEMVRNKGDKGGRSRLVSALEKHINNSIEKEQLLWERISYEKKYLTKRNFSVNSIKRFFNYYGEIEESIEVIKKQIVDNICYDIKKLHKENQEWKEFYIEYYMKKEKGDGWKTPNEIRYFLSERVIELAKACCINKKIAEDKKMELEKYKNRLLQLEKLEEIRDINKYFKRKKIGRQLEDIFDGLIKVSKELLYAYVCFTCFEEMEKYIEKILHNYQKYFEEYESTMYRFRRRLHELSIWFNNSVQGVDWIVCTKEKCLKEMRTKMKQKKEYFRIGGEVSAWLYKYCNPESDYKKRYQEEKIQENVLKEMWQEMFTKTYDEFDIDLFEAFSKEAEYLGQNIDKNIYIIQQLEQAANNFSVPLLTWVRKESGDVAAKCIYPPDLAMLTSYDEVKKKYFEGGRGFEDVEKLDTDKQSIIFYQNRYGLESFMIDFTLMDTGVDDNFPLGAGYKAYKNVLNNITGFMENATLTPHIDNTWHRQEIMPDMHRERLVEYHKWAFFAIFVENTCEIEQEKVNYFIWNISEAKMKCQEKSIPLNEEEKKELKKMLDEYLVKCEDKKYCIEYINIVKEAIDKLINEV